MSIDLTGRVFGHFTVLEKVRVDTRRVPHWKCKCACGTTAIVAANNLASGNSKSCGCSHGVEISDPITLEQLKKLVAYNPKTGFFRWKVSARGCKKGSIAGYYNKHNGYRRLIFKSRHYYAHVLAWLYMTGDWPPAQIDHRDRDGDNNKWSNLRLATPSQNGANRTKTKKNKSGYKGVMLAAAGKFSAKITYNKTVVPLGLFDDAVTAARAYDAAAAKYHGPFARTNF